MFSHFSECIKTLLLKWKLISPCASVMAGVKPMQYASVTDTKNSTKMSQCWAEHSSASSGQVGVAKAMPDGLAYAEEYVMRII